jgi:putative restriction endonuclease
LALLDLLDAGRLRPDALIAVEDLADRFADYCGVLADLGWKTERARLVYPSFHLRFDDFWHLVAVPGREAAVRSAAGPTSLGAWQRSVQGVRLDSQLAAVLRDTVARAELRDVLLTEYFGPLERAELSSHEQLWSEQDAALSGEILSLVGAPFELFHPAKGQRLAARPVRDRVFRLWVVPAYDHTCAVCGLRLMTPEGRSAVDAAHIVERARSNNDDPRNGLALCGVHHWSFDRGLISVDEQNRVLVSRLVSRDDPRAELLVRFGRASLRQPSEANLRPADEAFAWHRANVFRGSSAA